MHRLIVIAIIVTGCGEHGTSNPPVDTPQPPPADMAPPADAPPVDMAPLPDAPPAGVTCTTKDDPVVLPFTCHVIWSDCTDGNTYDLTCNIQNVGGNVFSLCDCTESGVKGEQFISTTVCMSTTFEQVEAVANDKCMWMIH